MDRIEITAKNIEELLRWRDEHKDEVRSHPLPMKSVEIVILDNGYRIKAVRVNDFLKLGLNIGGRSVGACNFQRRKDGMFVAEDKNIRLDASMLNGNDKREVARSMLTVYCSLMAFIVFGKVVVDSEEIVLTSKSAGNKAAHRGSKRRSSGITYIITKAKSPQIRLAKSSHASPSGSFSVRGHYRHYKSGKVVWINEYRKGESERKKKKLYKIGGEIQNEDCQAHPDRPRIAH